MKMGTRNVAAKQATTRRAKCVARDKFTKAKDENVVERILTTQSQRVAVITNSCMIGQPSVVAVRRSCNRTAIKVVAGIILTTATHNTAVTAEFMKKPMKRTLVVVGKVMMRIKTFVAKEISTPMKKGIKTVAKIKLTTPRRKHVAKELLTMAQESVAERHRITRTHTVVAIA